MKLQESMTGFYYIGNDRENITKLVNIYKRGYASGNFNSAMAELTRENHLQPEVICCEAGYGFDLIKQWAGLLSKYEKLSKTPFIINTDNMSTVENCHFISNRSVDDILNLKGWDENNLRSKIRFLQKCKQSTPPESSPALAERISVSLQHLLTRAFDMLVSFTILIFLAPVFLLIALAIRMEGGGDIFYRSKRAGKGYRIFNFYKFRTMVPGADKRRNEITHLNQYQDSELARFYKFENDPRITRIGKFLRSTSLDELPQLFNVLLGDMSLVGNRPLPLYEAETLTSDHDARRFMAKAGITGLWQIKKTGSASMSADERIKLDIDYADKSNLLFDMWIMAHTPQALLKKANT